VLGAAKKWGQLNAIRDLEGYSPTPKFASLDVDNILQEIYNINSYLKKFTMY